MLPKIRTFSRSPHGFFRNSLLSFSAEVLLSNGVELEMENLRQTWRRLRKRVEAFEVLSALNVN